MENFHTIRALARKCHAQARSAAFGSLKATDLLAGAQRITEIARSAVPPDDPLLDGAEAVYDPFYKAVFFKNSVPTDLANFYQAHEYGHHWIDEHTGVCSCRGGDIDESASEERMALGLERVEGYSQHERRECQANVFAREFLLPGPEASRMFMQDRMGAKDIAEHLDLPIGLVNQQLSVGLLVPDWQPEEKQKNTVELDPFQKEAAETQAGPLLVEAGPGTGKTRTLTARVQWLVEGGTDPSKILALTFSNKAAGELRERVERATPKAAAAIWAGTFHAFGLELLRKHGHLIGLPERVRVIDPSEALELLEAELPTLQLEYYLDLIEPGRKLRDILKAISRAKDELVTPERYRELAQRMAQLAQSEDRAEEGHRAIEVARVYATYQDILKREGAVDFGDLIALTVEVLKQHPTAQKEVQEQFRHVLVDEYQDVNRASGVLLKLIAGDGENLWVIGDARQSIYRFRGASPLNIRGFDRDFVGASRKSLGVNYRSRMGIVRVVGVLATHVDGQPEAPPVHWHANRGHGCGDYLAMEIAPDIDSEAAGLARTIKERQQQGIAFRNQAVLCRSHTYLARFAALLETHNVPVLYLGNLFERPEIRDLLALISFICEPNRGGLFRVARFPEYAIPLTDVRTILRFATDYGSNALDALEHLNDIGGLSEAGRAGLTLLAQHLAGCGFASHPAAVLGKFLFARSRYLDQHIQDDGVTTQQRRLALYQFLQFANNFKSRGDGDPKRHFLEWIRRLELFRDERQMRQPPAAAAGIDAVRMITVHASKGLEFDSVYVPGLGSGKFPSSRQYQPCPPPSGMIEDTESDPHGDEERCLFFVAVSRARDFLCLSRAERYEETRKSSPSSFLTALEEHLPRNPSGEASWPAVLLAAAQEEVLPHLAFIENEHTSSDLDLHIRCGQAYLFQRVLGLAGGRSDNSYARFHRCVHKVLKSLREKPGTTPEEALLKLDEYWNEEGPAGHVYESMYRQSAEEILLRGVLAQAYTKAPEEPWMVQLTEGNVFLRPDAVTVGDKEVLVRTVKTGRAPKSLPDEDIYALYLAAAQQLHPGLIPRAEVWYLGSGTALPVNMGTRAINYRLQKYNQAITDIRQGNFPAKPDDHNCPRCPHYFVCPGVPKLGQTPPI